ncbi:hypothetical protein ABVT39_024538 [Epinephelus coioides]
MKKKVSEAVESTSLSMDMLKQFEEVKKLINFRCDSIDCKIIHLEEKLERTTVELKAVSAKVAHLEQRVAQVEQPVKQITKSMDELETYTRRWNLRLVGVPESDQEDVCSRAITICQEVLPDNRDTLAEHVDTVHRLGRRRQPAEGTNPRRIIIQFISRVSRDAVWRAIKTSLYLRERGFQFKEDLSKGDRERRERLWPAVERARADGKKAFFAGARAFIEGEGEIKLPE